MVEEVPEESSGGLSINIRVFQAMVTRSEDAGRAERVRVMAGTLMEARRMLEEEHGRGNIYGLHDQEEAEPLG